MKKLLLLIAFLFACQNVNAMGIPDEYGARLAMNMGKFNKDWPNWDADRQFKVGLITGVFATLMIHTQMALMAEILYTQKGNKFESSYSGGSSTYTYLMHYLTLNFFYQYYFWQKFSVFAGPQMSLLLAASQAWKSDYSGDDESDIKSELNPLELGLMFGIAYQFTFGLIVDLRYGMGLTNVWKDKFDYNMRNTMLVLGVAYTFNLLMPRTAQR